MHSQYPAVPRAPVRILRVFRTCPAQVGGFATDSNHMRTPHKIQLEASVQKIAGAVSAIYPEKNGRRQTSPERPHTGGGLQGSHENVRFARANFRDGCQHSSKPGL